MNTSGLLGFFLLGVCALSSGASPAPVTLPQATVFYPTDATFLETLAAREVRRYLYLRTGQLFPVTALDQLPTNAPGAIVVARKDRPLVTSLPLDDGTRTNLATLKSQSGWLHTLAGTHAPVILLTGGDELGSLYAAYRFCEHLGIRFYLHGDVVPDQQSSSLADAADYASLAPWTGGNATNTLGSLTLPSLEERIEPLFAIRGVVPFNNFPEGPDWWNRDNYLAVIGQLAKMRLNFMGFHTYPEDFPYAEPTTWIGLTEDIAEGGRVRSSYSASYQNTLRWYVYYLPMRTSSFALGCDQLFTREYYGDDVMRGIAPVPLTADEGNEVFYRAGFLLGEVVAHARALGVKTALGPEIPLIVPRAVQSRLQALGKDPQDPATVEALFEGTLRRAMQVSPVDYFWLWTREGWTWQGASTDEVQTVLNQVKQAIAAAQAANLSCQVGMCGWMLGAPQDRLLFDRLLPLNSPLTALNRDMGTTPLDAAFSRMGNRPRWAIPWLEDDPGLTAPQFWVGRVRRDAAAALRYGCNGLIGLHWRTASLGPNSSALSQAAWGQAAWNPRAGEGASGDMAAGAVDGSVGAYANNPIAGTDEAPIYQTIRYGMSGYWLPVTNGTYAVTLKFCEPVYADAGRRVFDVILQGQVVLSQLDLAARVGINRAWDYTIDTVTVTNNWLAIEFSSVANYAAIAGIVVQSPTFVKKINCGGPAYKDYEADSADYHTSSDLASADFYADWARAQFGLEVGGAAAEIFRRLDGHTPRPVEWIFGPGDVSPNSQPWDGVSPQYGFVDDFATLAPQVTGQGNHARFDWWLAHFRYLRATARLGCLFGSFNQAMAALRLETSTTARANAALTNALPLRIALVQGAEEVVSNLLAFVSTPGELGTVANWSQKNLAQLIRDPGTALSTYLGGSLPAEAQLRKGYVGPTRVIVPAVRSAAAWNEELVLTVLLLSAGPPGDAAVFWRVMGQGPFNAIPLSPVSRGVYSVRIPACNRAGDDLEYYVKVVDGASNAVYFPPTAPRLNQTVTLVEEAPGPRLQLGLGPAAGAFQVNLKGSPNNGYQIESAPDLLHWASWSTNVASPEGDVSVLATPDSTSPAGFYRAKRE